MTHDIVLWSLTLLTQLVGLALLAGVWQWEYSYPRWRLAWGLLATAIVLILLRSLSMLLDALGLPLPLLGTRDFLAHVMPLLTSLVAASALWAFRQIYDNTLPMMQAPRLAIIVIDHNAVIVAWDSEAEALFGWSAAEAVGQPLAALVLVDPMHVAPLHVWLDVTDDERVPPPQVVLLARHRNGQRLPVQVNVTRVLLASGGTALRGAVCRLVPA